METTSPSTKSAAKLSSKEIKALVASHLAEQPENIRTFHRLMNVLESISVGIIILVFITALVLSFMWQSIPTQAIPAAWFLLPVSGAILLLLICVHAIVLRIFPPSSLYLVLQNGSSIPFSGKTRAVPHRQVRRFVSLGIARPGRRAGWLLRHLRLGCLDGQLGLPDPHDHRPGHLHGR